MGNVPWSPCSKTVEGGGIVGKLFTLKEWDNQLVGATSSNSDHSEFADKNCHTIGMTLRSVKSRTVLNNKKGGSIDPKIQKGVRMKK
jgi:hypothetical protein